ncbi:11019_t:CDS:2, partial [Racocetra fulgida]
ADASKLELIKKVLLFGLLKIIKEVKIEDFNNLTREQEINQILLFKPFYGQLDMSIHNIEKDNKNFKEIIIRFQEFNRFDQFDQWIKEKDIQEILNILETNTDK